MQMLTWPILFLILLFGCTVGPKYEPPVACIPDEWHAPTSEGMCRHESPDSVLWWESLNDPILNSLIQRAAQQNLDLFIASIRILEARAIQKAGSSDLYPHIDASAAGGHFYYSKDALINGLMRTAIPKDELKHNVKRNVNFFEVGFDAEWEIDLFGHTAHEINALKAQMQATEENLADIWVTLSAEIAKNYIELRGLQERLIILNKNMESQIETRSLTQELVDIGYASTIDFKQTEQQLSLLAAEKPLLELGIDKIIHRLSILLAESPESLFCELKEIRQLPVIPFDKPIGIPSELLRRRPDIRRAERGLAAATERVGSAVAALFPRFSLRGFIGDISTKGAHLFNPASTTWIAFPQLLMPVFNSKLLKQDVELNKMKVKEAFYEYKKTVLGALEESENAIASFHYEMARNHHLREAQEADREAYKLTFDLYQIGVKDYLEVLVINRSALSTEDAYIQSKVNLLLHYISLYKALGGSWEDCD